MNNVIDSFKLLYYILSVEIMTKFMKNLMAMISIDDRKKCYSLALNKFEKHVVAILEDKPTKQICVRLRHKKICKICMQV